MVRVLVKEMEGVLVAAFPGAIKMFRDQYRTINPLPEVPSEKHMPGHFFFTAEVVEGQLTRSRTKSESFARDWNDRLLSE